jgi:hypothetical protein
MPGTDKKLTGLFVAAYEISTGLAGAPTLHVHLVVDAPSKAVTGIGYLTQAVSPAPTYRTWYRGSFTYLTFMPNEENILVTAVGYPPGTLPIEPIAPNGDLRMALDASWTAGVATFRYDGHEIENATVRLVQPAIVAGTGPDRIELTKPKERAKR